ncbi:sodium/glutamate symporter [Paeniglutamicibacter psychrophenolicus]|uniref:Sodium/glutamate symporter n=1 Tax=Paeniglutamicibacter psychrophenolicus TaxID=257454 RepID=A0ABS4W9G9_9MICC|nr:sodium/glutamate symporter [Paeniglutamicibacter psychrophenolicus]MBP2372838.1 ESS family glutamate:Na+ symporter [Paeniglutamicibacter psychrophenolicus]
MDIQLDLVQSSALAMLLLAGGEFARRRIGFLHRFCIPAPVVGGFMFAVLVLLLRQTDVAQIQLDTTLQTPAMVAFFTTIGLAGSLATIKKGGKLLLMYLIACWSLAIMQNVIGMTMAKVVGVEPMLGIMAGAVALEGGHGNAAAFGPTAEAMGFEGATTVAIAAATFGLVAGSMLGGMTANYLVARHNIEIPEKAGVLGKLATAGAVIKEMAVGDGNKGSVATVTRTEDESSSDRGANYGSLLTVVVLLATLMVLGTVLGDWLSALTGLTLPAYVGAMIVAVIFRNVNDKFAWFKINDDAVELISKFALGFFLTLAMMSLKMWELASLAGPLVIILVVQLAFILIFAVVVVFRMLGKNYDAATMVAGFIGHGLGAAPNALANMDAFNAKFGVRSERAFLIVPLAGAVLVDLVALPWIVWCMNLVS